MLCVLLNLILIKFGEKNTCLTLGPAELEKRVVLEIDTRPFILGNPGSDSRGEIGTSESLLI